MTPLQKEEIMSNKPRCCFIDDNGEECEADAEYDIYIEQPSDPYCNTHACLKHVGDLLSDASHHHVYRLK